MTVNTDLTGQSAQPEATPLPRIDATCELIRQVESRLDELESLASLLSSEQAPPIEPPPFEVPESFLLSVVIPVYNERETLYKLLAQVAQLPMRRQLILVDDCSTDGTRELLRDVERAGDVTVIYHERNQGKGAALRTGFAAAKGDVVVIQDADLEYHPGDIPGLLGPLLSGEADVVYGSRFLEGEQDPSWIHRFGNWLLTWSSNCFTGLRLTDMETCYKAFRREWLAKVTLQQDRFGFEPEVTAKLARRGCRFAEVPISYNARGYREGKKIGLKDLFNAFYCIVRYGWAD
ncbi:MAG: glycosyltransferase family 2 protein [Planctomycetales bacterium]|nr:glycosyltransferase family 2 protein [Planctomycetales bacterium]